MISVAEWTFEIFIGGVFMTVFLILKHFMGFETMVLVALSMLSAKLFIMGLNKDKKKEEH